AVSSWGTSLTQSDFDEYWIFLSELAGVMRDILGNPFRSPMLETCLRAPTIDSLARAAYEDRPLPSAPLDSVRLGALADALEEAGCAATTLLGHLRGSGPHVLGCWAVDLCLGLS